MSLFAAAGDRLPALTGTRLLHDWQLDPVAVALLALAAAMYLYGMREVARRHPTHPWPVARAAAFLTGLAVIAVALLSGIGVYDDTLFWVHMVQHLLLIMVAPPLLVAGRPVILALHASRHRTHRWIISAVRSRAVTVLTAPPLVVALYAATIIGTHLSGFMNVVLTHPVAHDAEHVLYIVVGYLYFLPIFGDEPIRWRVSYPARLLLVTISMPVDTFSGLALMSTNHELFPAYAAQHRDWGPSLVTDLHWGGSIMWIAGDAIMLVLLLLVFQQWWAKGARRGGASLGWIEAARRATLLERTAVSTPGGADAATPTTRRAASGDLDDDDAELAAYNAWLARLAGKSRRQ